jgi:hypothetical protein
MRAARLIAVTIAAVLLGSCSSLSTITFTAPTQHQEELLSVVTVAASRYEFVSLMGTRVPDPCAIAYFDGHPNTPLSLQVRRVGDTFEVRLASAPLGDHYDKYRQLSRELEQALLAVYGPALVVERDQRTYTLCSAK